MFLAPRFGVFSSADTGQANFRGYGRTNLLLFNRFLGVQAGKLRFLLLRRLNVLGHRTNKVYLFFAFPAIEKLWTADKSIYSDVSWGQWTGRSPDLWNYYGRERL